MRSSKLIFLSAILFLSISPIQGYAEEIIQIKVLAVNPSDKQTLDTEISYPLPPEIGNQDILDSAGMEIAFDKEKGAYVLVQKVQLLPSETKTFVVRVRNVWDLPDEEIDAARVSLQQDLKTMEGTDYYDSAKLLVDKAMVQLDVLEEEKNQPMGIRQKIELFRSHQRQLQDLKAGILSMEALQKAEAQKGQEVPTVSFIVTAENPSSEKREMTVRAELPRDIKPDDVIEKAGFLIMYDEEKGKYFLEQQREFGPNESKKFDVKLKDIWRVPDAELDYLQEQADKIQVYFKGSPYEAFAAQNGQVIMSSIKDIRDLQAEVAYKTVDEKMRAHVLNSQKLKIAQKKLKELQDMMLELPIKKKEDTILEKLTRGIREVQKIADVSKILSMGLDPKISTTWWIIFGIMIFLAIIALVFYVTWLGKLNKDPFKSAASATKGKIKKEEAPPNA